MSHILVFIHLLAFHCGSDYSFSKLKKMLRVGWYFFVVSLNPIKRFDFETWQPDLSFELNHVGVFFVVSLNPTKRFDLETCQPDSSFELNHMGVFFVVSLNPIKRFDLETCQPDSSFELNHVGVNPKWIIQFNGSKYNLDDR